MRYSHAEKIVNAARNKQNRIHCCERRHAETKLNSTKSPATADRADHTPYDAIINDHLNNNTHPCF